MLLRPIPALLLVVLPLALVLERPVRAPGRATGPRVPGGSTKGVPVTRKPRCKASIFRSLSFFAKVSISGSLAKKGCGCLSPFGVSMIA